MIDQLGRLAANQEIERGATETNRAATITRVGRIVTSGLEP